MPQQDQGHRPAGWLIAAAVVPFLLLALWHWSLGPGLHADDYGHYLLHARALVEGRPYGDIGFISTAFNPVVAPEAQPPGLPVTLAPILALAGEDWFWFRLLMVASGAGFVALAAAALMGAGPPGTGAGAAAMAGAALGLVYATANLGSDLGFCAFLWAVVLAADRPGPWTLGRLAVLALAGSAALLYRLAGVPLIAALVLTAIVRWREPGVRPAAPLVAWTVTLLVVVFGFRTTGAVGGLLDFRPLELAGFVARNLAYYRFALAESLLYPFPAGWMNDAWHAGAGLTMLWGLWRWLREAWRTFLAHLAAAYLLFLLILPIHDPRYLWPLFPLFAWGFLSGLQDLLRRAGVAAARAAALTVAGIAAVLALASDTTVPRPERLMDQPDVQRTVSHLRAAADHAPVRAVFPKPRSLTWHTGIPAMAQFVATPEETVAELDAKGISHVVTGSLGFDSLASGSLAAAARAYPARFREELDAGRFVVYRFRPGPLP